MVCEPPGVESLSMQAVTAAIRHPSSMMSPECTEMLSSTHSAGGQSLAQPMLDLTLKRYPQLPFTLSPTATYKLQWRLTPGLGWQLGPQGSFGAGSRVPMRRKDPHTCVVHMQPALLRSTLVNPGGQGTQQPSVSLEKDPPPGSAALLPFLHFFVHRVHL